MTTMMNESQTIFSSLLASSLLVGMPSLVIMCIFFLLYVRVIKRKLSPKDNLPPIISSYIVQCLYSITSYWDKIIPQAKYYRFYHDFIVFQCLSVIFSIKLIEFLKMGDRSSKELANLTKTNERNLSRLLYRLTNEGYLLYNEKDGRYSINKQTLTIFEQRHFMGMTSYEHPTHHHAPTLSGHHNQDGADIKHNSTNSTSSSTNSSSSDSLSFLSNPCMTPDDTYLKRLFEAAMKQKNELNKLHQEISSCFEFSRFKQICDLCGGFGYLSFQILRRHPQCEIIVLETEEAVKHGLEISINDPQKKTLLDDKKINFKIGDIFQPRTIPMGVHAYILMQILCIWNDDDCRRILSSVATVMRKEKNQSGISPSLIVVDYISQSSSPTEKIIEQQQYQSIETNNKNTIVGMNSPHNNLGLKKSNNTPLPPSPSSLPPAASSIPNKTTSMDIVMIGIVGREFRNQKQWDSLFRDSGLITKQCNKVSNHQSNGYSSSTTENLYLMELVVI